MSEKQFVVQEDVNTDKIILLIDYKRMKMYSFLAEEREAVNKICNYLNWFDECTHNYAVMLKEIEESNCEKSKEIAKLKREIVELKEELQRFKKYVFSEDNILCYKCEHCIKKDIYVVDCEMKGKVDVHSICSLFREVKV